MIGSVMQGSDRSWNEAALASGVPLLAVVGGALGALVLPALMRSLRARPTSEPDESRRESSTGSKTPQSPVPDSSESSSPAAVSQ